MSALNLRSRARGALLGLAIGDALGTTLEFQGPGPHGLTDMVGGGPFHLQAGQWTDDTSMALCLGASMAELGRFDPLDQMQRYVRWWHEGYLSCTGRCFDIGATVSAALRHFESAGEPYAGSTDPHAAGNGSLMRMAPVPLFFCADAAAAIAHAALSSRTTHGARTCLDACRYYAGLIWAALNGVDKDTLLSERYCPALDLWAREPLCREIDEIASGSFRRREPPEIVGSGYVVKSLEAALWAFYRSASYEEGALLAVNLGDDADTTGAIYGQLAGAYYGEQALPASWRDRLAWGDRITALADALVATFAA